MAKVKDNEQEVVGTDNGTQQGGAETGTQEQPTYQMPEPPNVVDAAIEAAAALRPTTTKSTSVSMSGTSGQHSTSTTKVGPTNTTQTRTLGRFNADGTENPQWRKAYDEYKTSLGKLYGVDPETGEIDDKKYLTDILGVNPERLEKQREEKRQLAESKRKEANLYNALAVLGDMMSTAIGGNVWKRDKMTIAKDAVDEINKLEEEANKQDKENAKAIQDAKAKYAELLHNYAKELDNKLSTTTSHTDERTQTTESWQDPHQTTSVQISQKVPEPKVTTRTGSGGGSSNRVNPNMVVSYRTQGGNGTTEHFEVDGRFAKQYAQQEFKKMLDFYRNHHQFNKDEEGNETIELVGLSNDKKQRAAQERLLEVLPEVFKAMGIDDEFVRDGGQHELSDHQAQTFLNYGMVLYGDKGDEHFNNLWLRSATGQAKIAEVMQSDAYKNAKTDEEREALLMAALPIQPIDRELFPIEEGKRPPQDTVLANYLDKTWKNPSWEQSGSVSSKYNGLFD